STTSIIFASSSKGPHLLDVDGLEVVPDPIHEHFQDQYRDEHIEKDSHLDDKRDAVRCKQRDHENAVLQHQKSQDLSESAPPVDRRKKPDQKPRECERDAVTC